MCLFLWRPGVHAPGSFFLEDVELGKVAAIIVVDWNRLSRDEDEIDGLKIKKTCKDNGTIILSPGRVYDFEQESDSMLACIEMMFAANQKRALVKATTRGQYAKARAGGWVGGIAPYGYRVVYDVAHRDGRPRGRLVIDPEEAEVVRLVFRLYLAGRINEHGEHIPMSIQNIAPYLYDAGYRVRVRRTQKETGDSAQPCPDARHAPHVHSPAYYAVPTVAG